MEPSRPDISIIIVSYNVKEFLNQSLRSVQKAVGNLSAEIIVVDNASQDGTADFVRKHFPKVKVLENHENLGFARANNQAIRQAKGRFLVLINPDTLVQEDTFQVMLDFFADHPEAGVAGCKILNPDGSLQLACRRSFPTPWVALTRLLGLSTLFPRTKLFGQYNLTYLDPEETTRVDAVSGSFMMVRREAMDAVGMLDERFFMYGEDLDWCYRIKQAGWEIYYVPKTQIVHYKGASSEKARLDTLLTFYKAMLLFVRKHFRRRYLFFPQWFLIMGIGIRAAFSFVHNLLSRLKLPLIDLIFLNLSLALALLLRFHSLVHWRSYLLVTAIYSTIWLITFYFSDLYHHHKFSPPRAFGAVLFGLFVNSAITYFARSFAFSRLVVLLAGLLNALFIPGWRWGLRLAAERLNWPWLEGLRKKYFRNETIVVGKSKFVQNILERAKQNRLPNTEIVAAMIIDPVGGSVNGALGVPVVTDPENLPWHIEQLNANEVIFDTDSISYEKILGIISSSQDFGVEFKMVSGDPEVLIGSQAVEYLGDLPLIEVDHRLAHAPYRFLKRSVDIIFSLIFLMFLIPGWFLLLLKGYRFKRVPVYSLGGQRDRSGALKELMQGIVLQKKGQHQIGFKEKSPLFLWVLLGKLTLAGVPIALYPEQIKSAELFRNLKPGLLGLIPPEVWKQDPRRVIPIYINYLKNYSPLIDIKLVWQAMNME